MKDDFYINIMCFSSIYNSSIIQVMHFKLMIQSSVLYHTSSYLFLLTLSQHDRKTNNLNEKKNNLNVNLNIELL